MKKKMKFNPRFIIVLLCFLIQTAILVGFLAVLILFPTYYYSGIIAVVAVYLIDAIVGCFIFSTKVIIDFKLSWLAVVIVFPLVGPILYILYAQKLTTKRKMKLRYNPISEVMDKAKEDSKLSLDNIKKVNNRGYTLTNYLYQSGKASLYQNTEVNYYKIGQDGFAKIIEELKKAKKFIFVEYFIIEYGEIFGCIYEILKEKAKLGVDVRLIYDDFGSSQKVSSYFYKTAIKDGIKCFPFNRIRPTIDIRQNCRDHRKVIVIDGIVGFTGGVNLADEYANIHKRFGLWKDNVVMLKGEGVNGLTSIFLTNWVLNEKINEDINLFRFNENKHLLLQPINATGFVQAYAQVPFIGEDIARNTYLKMINLAQDYIYISTPYLIPDEEILTALINASKSGVNVKIVLPGIPDKKLTYFMSRSNYGQLLSNGVEIYQYDPGFNHTKMMVVDDKFAITGSINLDYRSLFLNFENAVLFIDNPVILNMKDDLVEMFNESTKQDTEYWVNRPFYYKAVQYLIRIIAPLM